MASEAENMEVDSEESYSSDVSEMDVVEMSEENRLANAVWGVVDDMMDNVVDAEDAPVLEAAQAAIEGNMLLVLPIQVVMNEHQQVGVNVVHVLQNNVMVPLIVPHGPNGLHWGHGRLNAIAG